MKKTHGIFFIFIFLLLPLMVSAEDITITTYYPSPYGSYDELQTANNTYLATGGGFVGIGNTTASEKLDVTGNVRATGMITGNVVRANNGFQGRGIVNQIMSASPNTDINYAGGVYSNMNGMSLTLTTTATQSILLVLWNAGICQVDAAMAGSIVHVRAVLNPGNIQIGTYMGGAYSWDGVSNKIIVDSMGGNHMISVGPGTYTITLQWKTSLAGQAWSRPPVVGGYGRSMTVMEIIQQP
jgi:hypothetical protein